MHLACLDDPAARAADMQANVIGMLTQDPTQRAAREQEIMGNLTALQAPEQERQRLALEERLFGARKDRCSHRYVWWYA